MKRPWSTVAGLALGQTGTVSQALCQAKDKKHALESLDRCIVSGYWELKRKFLLKHFHFMDIVRSIVFLKEEQEAFSLWIVNLRAKLNRH